MSDSGPGLEGAGMLGMEPGAVNASRPRIHANRQLAALRGFLLHFAPLNKAHALRRGCPDCTAGSPANKP